MQRSCLLDFLPIELLHNLFAYFVTNEVLFSFSDVSEYLNGAVLSYVTRHPNFKSIRRSFFDVICCHLIPEQVISLTLSDNDDTPAQSELFFSRFSFEQFTQLRSLALINIEFQTLQDILSNLHQLERLRSLSFDDESSIYRYPDTIDRTYVNLLEVYSLVVPQLTRLHLNSGAVLISIPAPYLTHLKLDQCSLRKLERIFQNAPELKSLNVCLDNVALVYGQHLQCNQLTRLDLRIESK